jgi:hypothetical protein
MPALPRFHGAHENFSNEVGQLVRVIFETDLARPACAE